MRNDHEDFLSRKEKHEESITKLLSDDSRESTNLILYTGKISYLERKYHDLIKITKGDPFNNTKGLPLFICVVEKQH